MMMAVRRSDYGRWGRAVRASINVCRCCCIRLDVPEDICDFTVFAWLNCVAVRFWSGLVLAAASGWRATLCKQRLNRMLDNRLSKSAYRYKSKRWKTWKGRQVDGITSRTVSERRICLVPHNSWFGGGGWRRRIRRRIGWGGGGGETFPCTLSLN